MAGGQLLIKFFLIAHHHIDIKLRYYGAPGSAHGDGFAAGLGRKTLQLAGSREIPRNLDIEVSLYSEAPGGCSTGTSAAVSVALIGAPLLFVPVAASLGLATGETFTLRYAGLQRIDSAGRTEIA